MFAPCTVTLADPVPARFPLVVPEIATESTDHASVTVPAPSPTVNVTPRVCRTPPPTLHRTDDSDS
eukprot:CAMPEP_0180340918 /NCGR_PEP_ID=MMETSP0989-20121125/919_1 /TAXON_ID=697907 /ORGANISM="non described non described, Strain CCMP2293" /LENGTH=65 /DNA_ID=CAMNT_0022329661 /DNA_START=97 /DNA_END=290 /DNA_ORIENTATION=-